MNEIENAINELKEIKKYAEILGSPDEFFQHMQGHRTELSFVLTAFDIAEMADKIIKALEAQQAYAWIPISERLPSGVKEVFQVTIVRQLDNYKWVQSLLWEYDHWRWWEEDDGWVDEELYRVTAWMPLPSPYKEEAYDANRKGT